MSLDAADGANDALRFDDPRGLAAAVAARPRPLLVGLDIDGVLAPIVAHASDSRLLDGVSEVVERIARGNDVMVAAVSGRSLASVHTFEFPPAVRLVGSHGMEADDGPAIELEPDEAALLTTLTSLARDAATRAGDGAWVEYKSASVVLHVREADDELGATALRRLADDVSTIEGATAKPGSEVLELFARSASKGTAIRELAARFGAATTVFVGDDVTDEEAFAALGDRDVRIKVGAAATIAEYRLPDPHAVLDWLRATAELVDDDSLH